MSILIGLLCIAATLHASTVSLALRATTAARLSDLLSERDRNLWLDRLDAHESRLLIAASLVRLIATMATVVWAYGLFLVGSPEPTWFSLAAPTGLVIALLAIFYLAVPHALAMNAGDRIVARHLPIMWTTALALLPVIALFQGVDALCRRLLGRSVENTATASEQAEAEILHAISEGERQGAVDEDQKEMIESVLDLRQVAVGRIMTPRTQIEAMPSDATIDQIREKLIASGHSRIPIFEETIDRVIGVIYAKDMLKLRPGEPVELSRLLRQAIVVPETTTLHDLLNEFRAKRVQIAIVLDEYGGTAGLATIEDILEELVGEIDDEYDTAEPERIRRVSEDTVEVDARVSVAEINEALGVELPDGDDYETAGGFVASRMGLIPRKGDSFEFQNVHVTVVDAEPRRVNRLRIRALPPVVVET